MPLTPEMRRKIDQIRDYLYGGGYPDPLSNAEQLAFLFFFYLIEGIDADNQLQAKATGSPTRASSPANGRCRNPLNAPGKGVETDPERALALVRLGDAACPARSLVRFVRDEVFAFFAEVAERSAMNFMDGARLGSTSRRCSPRWSAWSTASPRPGGCRHQGRPVRARAEADQAGGRAGPVPHAAPHHPRDRRDGRPARSARRSTTRPPAPRASWSPPTTTSGSPIPRRARSRRSRSTASAAARLRRQAERDAMRAAADQTFFGNDVDPEDGAASPP